ncbi:MAG: carbamoyltransferase, partial [Candidatus Lindowbacteria bacterium]|nr:carbamoyltransferase [Candidatus Lindowbacteria bacterium]
MRVILAMQEAHDASAAIMVDGVIVAAAQEERFSWLKGDYGYPKRAIEYCMKEAGIEAKDIDCVALASHNWNPVLTKIKRNANFSVDDWIKEQHEF